MSEERPIDLFATQRRSRWVQRMLVGKQSGFGYNDIPWFKRAILALASLDLEGQEVTASHIRDHVANLVGYPPNKPHLHRLVQKSVEAGILEPTGRKLRPKGSSFAMPSYVVAARKIEVDRATLVVEGTIRV